MIGREIKSVQEVCTEDGLADVSDNEGEIESSICDANLAVGEAVARDIRTVGSLQLPSVGTRVSLLGSRREDRPQSAAVDKPSR